MDQGQKQVPPEGVAAALTARPPSAAPSADLSQSGRRPADHESCTARDLSPSRELVVAGSDLYEKCVRRKVSAAKPFDHDLLQI